MTKYIPIFKTPEGKRFLVNVAGLKLDDKDSAREAGMCYFESVMFNATFTGDVYEATDDSFGFRSSITGNFGYVPVFVPDEFLPDWKDGHIDNEVQHHEHGDVTVEP